jgi:hypothetical protein
MTAHPCCVPKGLGPCSVRYGGRCVLLSKTPPGDKQVMFGPAALRHRKCVTISRRGATPLKGASVR